MGTVARPSGAAAFPDRVGGNAVASLASREDVVTMPRHPERHFRSRLGWIRAGVLGAVDGLTSVTSLMVGVAAASTSRNSILIAGIAGLAAGAMSMAVGEYVSVSSQRDSENADLERERQELEADPEGELDELTDIYKRRGLDDDLAARVARQLTARDPLAAHLRDELGLEDVLLARPLQAAIASAVSFTIGSLPPIVTLVLGPRSLRVPLLVVVALVTLALLGAESARPGGSPRARAALRLALGGAAAMAITGAIGKLAGVAGL